MSVTIKNEETQAKVKQDYTIVKRDGKHAPFRGERIEAAIEAAVRDVRGIAKDELLASDVKDIIKEVSELVISEALNYAEKGACLTVEGIQDLVEVKLMETGNHDIARGYIVYRDQQKMVREDSPRNLKVLRRDGSSARFNPMKIASSIEEAFRASQEIQGPTPGGVILKVGQITDEIVSGAMQFSKEEKALTVDILRDQIEKQLMTDGHFNVAKQMILMGTKSPQQEETRVPEKSDRSFEIEGGGETITENELRRRISMACKGLEELVSIDAVLESSIANFYDGIRKDEIDTSNIMAAKAKIEADPAYSYVAARLLLDSLYREAMGVSASDPELKQKHSDYFENYLKRGIELKRLNPELLDFDLKELAAAMNLERDKDFTYLGLQTLYDRYFIHEKEVRLETPQIFWMRVAMGLSLREKEKNKRAIEFYNTLSQFYYVSSTPTLFNAGTLHSQLSSCFLLTVCDDLTHIFKTFADNAQLSKFSGGIGDDWTNVRATGALINGTNGNSQGVIPFLKIANDTAVAVNQGGKRKGAMCAYLETWHLDIEDFLDLRKNTGDERRRTHDMNTANWIPDLFMKRVQQNGQWTLFSPDDVPDLHDLYGKAFETRYHEYEKLAEEGKIALFKKVEAVQLWRKMLSMLFETGHPWIAFKDPSNIRSPQDHVGVVHSSNLCTEILLNTSREETAVCNLGSVNLAKHTTVEGIDEERLAKTLKTAIRMLDNVIDLNYYPTDEAKNANFKHRPVGLGVMGFQDALYIQNLSYASHEAVEFADASMEMISYYAILGSSELAKERGTYSSYKGSKWDRGILPIDSLDLLEQERGSEYVEVDRTTRMEWDVVRKAVREHGMRNSNTMAVAPTATISNIAGVTQSIEPTYKHLFVKSNLSGEFTIPNVHLVEELKKRGLWDSEMIDDLKYFDGQLVEIERIPDEIKRVYLTAFEIEPEWLIECASRRQKWIDMGESLNLYLAEPSGKKIHNMYMEAWKRGLKTTYYLRSLGATQIEKSTIDINKRGLQPRWMKNESASSRVTINREGAVCNMEEECEACQ